MGAVLPKTAVRSVCAEAILPDRCWFSGKKVRLGIKKTLGFSKCWELHVARLKLFVHRYNLEIAGNILNEPTTEIQVVHERLHSIVTSRSV
jgi:hypothetical protein